MATTPDSKRIQENQSRIDYNLPKLQKYQDRLAQINAGTFKTGRQSLSWWKQDTLKQIANVKDIIRNRMLSVEKFGGTVSQEIKDASTGAPPRIAPGTVLSPELSPDERFKPENMRPATQEELTGVKPPAIATTQTPSAPPITPPSATPDYESKIQSFLTQYKDASRENAIASLVRQGQIPSEATTSLINPTVPKTETPKTETPSTPTAEIPIVPATNIKFKSGLTPEQQQSVVNLVQSGRAFNETDARNYAYSIGDTNWQQYVNKKITDNGTVLPTAQSQLQVGQWISPSKWRELQGSMDPTVLEGNIKRIRNSATGVDDIYWQAGPAGAGSEVPTEETLTPEQLAKYSRTFEAEDLINNTDPLATLKDFKSSLREGIDTLTSDIADKINQLGTFRTDAQKALEKSLGLTGLRGDIDKIRSKIDSVDVSILDQDKAINAFTNSIKLNYEAIRNQPIALSVLTGQLAHQQRLDSVTLDSLNGQKQVLLAQKQIELGNLSEAQDLYKNAVSQIENSVDDAIDMQKFQITQINNQIDNLRAEASTEEGRAFDLYKTMLVKEMGRLDDERKKKIDLMLDYPQAGILPTDSLADVSRKIAPYISAETGIKNIDIKYEENASGVVTVTGVDKTTGDIVYQNSLGQIGKGFKGTGGGEGTTKLTNEDLVSQIQSTLEANNAFGEDKKLAWESYLWAYQNWLNNNGTAQEFYANFPIGQYLDADNQYEFKLQIGQ